MSWAKSRVRYDHVYDAPISGGRRPFAVEYVMKESESDIWIIWQHYSTFEEADKIAKALVKPESILAEYKCESQG